MKKKMEFYEDAHERFEAAMKIIIQAKPSKKVKQFAQANAKPVRERLDRP